MSNATFSEYWSTANQELKNLAEYEAPKDPLLVSKDKDTSYQHIATLYIKYVQVYRKLEVFLTKTDCNE